MLFFSGGGFGGGAGGGGGGQGEGGGEGGGGGGGQGGEGGEGWAYDCQGIGLMGGCAHVHIDHVVRVVQPESDQQS